MCLRVCGFSRGTQKLEERGRTDIKSAGVQLSCLTTEKKWACLRMYNHKHDRMYISICAPQCIGSAFLCSDDSPVSHSLEEERVRVAQVCSPSLPLHRSSR